MQFTIYPIAKEKQVEKVMKKINALAQHQTQHNFYAPRDIFIV